MDEATHLVLPGVLHDLLIDDLIHDLEALDGLLLRDAHVGLLQGHGAEANGNTPPGRYSPTTMRYGFLLRYS